MIVGCVKEIKNNEFRVGMTPTNVMDYVNAGHKVLIQAGAGAGSGFSDQEYATAGATLVADANPIRSIHDVGAGGLSNAFPELVNDAGRGARFDLRAVPLEEPVQAPPGIPRASIGSPAQETSSPHGNGATKPHVPRARSQPLSRFSSARSNRASVPACSVPSIRPDSKPRP